MTAQLFNQSGGAVGDVVDAFVNPPFVYAYRAPTVNDNFYNPGTRWQDNSVVPPVMYTTTGFGLWYAIAGGGESLTALTVVGPTSLTGTTNINTTGTAATNIGNATGNTAVTGNETVSGNLSLTGAGSKLLINAGTPASASVGTSAAMTAGVVTVASTAVTAASIIIYARRIGGGTQGNVEISAQTAGSFTLTSNNVADTSTFNYEIIN